MLGCFARICEAQPHCTLPKEKSEYPFIKKVCNTFAVLFPIRGVLPVMGKPIVTSVRNEVVASAAVGRLRTEIAPELGCEAEEKFWLKWLPINIIAGK